MATPMHTRALLAALAAYAHTLHRCRGGFRDPAALAVVITRRTANALVDTGDAVFNDASCPSAITLTTAGVARARLLRDAQGVAA